MCSQKLPLACLLIKILGLFQAEARLAAKRAARAEAREIRMKELERQQREVTCGVLCGFLAQTFYCRYTGGQRPCCGHTCSFDIAHDPNPLEPLTSVQGQSGSAHSTDTRRACPRHSTCRVLRGAPCTELLACVDLPSRLPA